MMEQKKSKFIFLVIAFLAMTMLVLFSIFLAEGMWLLCILSLVLFVALFGYGFTLKAKYRKNDWL